MISRPLFASLVLAGATLLAAACSGSAEDTFAVDCAPGTLRPCDCAEGGSGTQTCATDGRGFGECACATAPPDAGAIDNGHCTLFPDCGSCEGCWATCVCQTSGDLRGCKQRCLVDGGGSTTSCDPGSCPPATGLGAQFAKACCTSEDACGLSVSVLASAGCQARNQPGTPDESCPAQSIQNFLTFQGCCRPDHTCGLQDTILGLGCVDPAAFGLSKGDSC
ncbi:MAG: hypothetical protein OZ921_00735 [Sorangiineae bacterium]|nr:hypothetical protein [Polyangiaceae bacterium]MEB2321009.1 hypothetical protein [Sorangiineae bacterium]